MENGPVTVNTGDEARGQPFYPKSVPKAVDM